LRRRYCGHNYAADVPTEVNATSLADGPVANASTHVHVRGVTVQSPSSSTDGSIITDTVVLAVNTGLEPLMVSFAATVESAAGDLEVTDIFQNRSISSSSLLQQQRRRLVWMDMLGPLATRAFRLSLKQRHSETANGEDGEDGTNLIENGSYERMANAGTPDGFYLFESDDDAAAFLCDGTTAVDGRYSMRVTTPHNGSGLIFRPFPQDISKAGAYALSVWAKAESTAGLGGGAGEGGVVQLEFATNGGGASDCIFAGSADAKVNFALTPQWKQYHAQMQCARVVGPTAVLQYSVPNQGVAWLDKLELRFQSLSSTGSSRHIKNDSV
jgi:hypothetical protein